MFATRHLYLLGGLSSLALGIVGAFLPILPTTPFILLSGFCFSRSSPRWHRWICQSPWFGPILKEWETHRGVRTSVKWLATSLLGISWSATLVSYGPISLIGLTVSAVASIGMLVVWRLPSI